MSQHLVRIVAVSIPLVTAACAAAKEQRCQAIQLQDASASLEQIGERDFNERLLGSLPMNYTSEQYAATKRRLRAQEAERLHADLKQKHPTDSFLWRSNPARDSADPEPVPPPKPSEMKWYAENCWQGHAR